MIQIRKPTGKDDPHQDKYSKVTSCILELLDGKHAGKLVSAVSMCIDMWGYNLAKANLNAVVKYGDPCQVEYKVAPKKEESDFTDALLVVRKVNLFHFTGIYLTVISCLFIVQFGLLTLQFIHYFI